MEQWGMSLCERENCLGFTALTFREVQEPSILLSLPCTLLEKKAFLKSLLESQPFLKGIY